MGNPRFACCLTVRIDVLARRENDGCAANAAGHRSTRGDSDHVAPEPLQDDPRLHVIRLVQAVKRFLYAGPSKPRCSVSMDCDQELIEDDP